MSEAIVTCLISAAVTLVGVFLSAKSTRDKISQDMKVQIEVIKNDMKHMQEELTEHNGYAKMFSEKVPKIEQHMSDVDRRLTSLENR